MAPTNAVDRLAELEQQRSFLLASLRDLEAERRAGDIDDHDYEALRDDYTRRAAEVLRVIDAGRAGLPPPRRHSWRWWLTVSAVVAVVALGVGIAVARSSGARLPDGRSIDDIDDVSTSQVLAQARASIEQNPQLAHDLYAEVLERDPDHAEARTYSAWLLVTQAMVSDDNELRRDAVDVAVERLGDVIDDEPNYPDPQCLLGVISVVDGAGRAEEYLNRCLELDPPADLRALATDALAPTTTTTTTAP